ncbi:hypothetical protein GQ457_01G004020 [Hibiscus cannabinus]
MNEGMTLSQATQDRFLQGEASQQLRTGGRRAKMSEDQRKLPFVQNKVNEMTAENGHMKDEVQRLSAENRDLKEEARRIHIDYREATLGKLYQRTARQGTTSSTYMKCVGMQYMEAIRRLKASGFDQNGLDFYGNDGAKKLAYSDIFKDMSVEIVLDEGNYESIRRFRASQFEFLKSDFLVYFILIKCISRLSQREHKMEALKLWKQGLERIEQQCCLVSLCTNAGAIFVDACLKGLNGVPDVVECSFVQLTPVTELPFFASKIDMEDSRSGHHSDMDLGNLMNMTWPTDLIDAMNIENSQGPNQPDPSDFLFTQTQQSQPYQYQLDEIWNDPTLLLQQNVVQNQVEVPILSQLNQRQQSQNSGQPSKSAERSKRNRENKKKEMESLKNEKIEATKIEEKLRDGIKNLNEEKRKLDTKIEELNTKIENLNKEKGALEEKIENLNKEKTEKEKDNKVLTANMTTIKDEIIKLAAQYESISCRQSDESTYIQSEFQQIQQKLETVQLNVMDVKHVVLASSKQWNENIPKQNRQLNIRREVVLELDVQDGNDKQKAMEIVSGLSGVDSVSKDMIDKLKVIGDVDLINLVSKLSKWKPRILTVGPAKEDKKEILFLEKKEEGGGGKKWDNDKRKEQIAEFPPAYRPPYNPFMHNPFMHNPYMHNPYMTMHYPDVRVKDSPNSCVII